MPNETVGQDERIRQLADGSNIPTLGFGVWQVPDGRACEAAVRSALEAGYRHIDTAQAYGNEASVGRALAASGVPRDEVFITTKFYPGNADPVVEARNSVGRLGVDHLDLYLVHWPQNGPTWAWPGMEEAKAQGLARSIGVSNFSASDLEQVSAMMTTAPVINQVQFSPFEYRSALLLACEQQGIAIEAYSPLGTGRHLSDPVVAEIATRIGRTVAQVLLRWCVQRHTIVLPKSTHRERIEENAQIYDFALSDGYMAILDGLDQTGGTDEARENQWW